MITKHNYSNIDARFVGTFVKLIIALQDRVVLSTSPKKYCRKDRLSIIGESLFIMRANIKIDTHQFDKWKKSLSSI